MPEFTHNEIDDILKIYNNCGKNARETTRIYSTKYPDRRHPCLTTIINLIRRAKSCRASATKIEYPPNEISDMLKLYTKCGKRFGEMGRQYKMTYPQRRQPSLSSIKQFVKRYQETGTVHARPRSGRPRHATDNHHETYILGLLFVYPEMSSADASSLAGVSQSSVMEIIHRHRHHPYHKYIGLRQSQRDFNNENVRIEYCNWMLSQEEENAQFLRDVVWSDEAKFNKSGIVKKSEIQFWSGNAVSDDITLGVWCALYGGKLLGPVFFHGTLDATSYINILKDNLSEAITSDKVWFQHDTAPPHFNNSVNIWLNQNFPDRWIGRGGAIEWPARSPDLAPIDFVIWDLVKDKVFEEELTTMEGLKDKIINAFKDISEATIQHITSEYSTRARSCVAANGGKFLKD